MNHVALGKQVSELDVVVVEDSRAVQSIMRTLLNSLGVKRVRVFDGPEPAITAMMSEAPDLILSDWEMSPLSGLDMIHAIRTTKMAPLCYVPVVFVTAHGTRENVTKAMRAGAHHLLVKPISAVALKKCLDWVCLDRREMVMNATGSLVLEGIERRLQQNESKYNAIKKAELMSSESRRRLDEIADRASSPKERANSPAYPDSKASQIQHPTKVTKTTEFEAQPAKAEVLVGKSQRPYGYTRGYNKDTKDAPRTPLEAAFELRRSLKTKKR